MERHTGHRLPVGAGVLLVVVFDRIGRARGSLQKTRVLTGIRMDGWARRHGW